MAVKISRFDSRKTPYNSQISEALTDWNNDQGYSSETKNISVVATDCNGDFLGGANIIAKWNYVLVDDLFVKSQKSGTGTQIMIEVEKIAKELNKTGIWLFTGGYQAQPFYEKLGFVETGRIPNLVGSHDEILLVKTL